MMTLSVVLIAKNQAWNISRLIESVLRETSSIPSGEKEIVLVDSASTDETVALAGRYPVKIVCLAPGQPLSPSIGRYVGYEHTCGQFMLFLDGDTELVQTWFTNALRVMRETPNAGAVTGRVTNLNTSTANEHVDVPERPCTDAQRDVLFGPGAGALYRRSVLEQVGTFNPYLYADEEPELGLRIRQAKYRIIELDRVIVRHYSYEPDVFSTMLSRRRKNFFLGIGQCFRYHLHDELLWPFIKERGYWSLRVVWWLAVGLVALLSLLVGGSPAWIEMWALASGLLLAVIAWQKRSLRIALVRVFQQLLMVEGLFRGFLIRPLPPESFHANVQTIKDAAAMFLTKRC